MICAGCQNVVEHDTGCSCGDDSLLDGRYRLLEIVGHGANGTTYRAIENGSERTVAIKELSIRKVESLKAIELFEREAKTLEGLSHAGIPKYHEDFQVDRGRNVELYLVQEFIDGKTLSLDRNRTTEEVFEIAVGILDILSYLHALRPPVIHRDIKPSNIMRRENGRLALIDFGSVKAALDTEGGSTIAGTFGYMAPEQFLGQTSPNADIFGVGATIVALLSGKDPVELSSRPGIIDLDQLELGAPLKTILTELVEPDFHARPSNANAIADQIRAILQAGEVSFEFSPKPEEEPTPTDKLTPTNKPKETQQPRTRKMRLNRVPHPALKKGRPTPPDFLRTYSPRAFTWLFGSGAAFTGSLVLLLFLVATSGLPTSQWFWMLWGSLAAFFAIGSLWGFNTRTELLRVYKYGKVVRGKITRSEPTSFQLDGRPLTKYWYEFTLGGNTYSGEQSTRESLFLRPGDLINIMFDPFDPKTNVIHEINQFVTRRAIEPSTVLDFGKRSKKGKGKKKKRKKNKKNRSHRVKSRRR